MSTLSFEPERRLVENAVAANGRTVVSCFLVPEKARDICVQYRTATGHLREIVITCVPGMTQNSVTDHLRRAMSEPT
jgi:hypothetical protein